MLHFGKSLELLVAVDSIWKNSNTEKQKDVWLAELTSDQKIQGSISAASKLFGVSSIGKRKENTILITQAMLLNRLK